MSEPKYVGKVNPQARTAGSISPDAVVQIIKWYIENNNIGSGSSGGGVTTETDPVFTASPAYGISAGQVSNWDAAYGWGDHGSENYIEDSDFSSNGLMRRTGAGAYTVASLPLSVSNGGTGRTTLTSGYVLLGNGTSDVTMTATASAFNKAFTSSGGSNGTAVSVARGDHYHSTLTRGNYLTGSNYNGSAGASWAVDATTAATASKVVARDGSGDIYVHDVYF